MNEENNLNVPTLEEYTKIVVETDENNPKTIAVITANDIKPSEGFRVRITPKYD
ncbi:MULTISPECIES: hypothetical protein [Enterococcus]|uniref:hypothetical protein n=1 Tax=Enterococcus TaxID=1350 RepID=UPI00163B81EB|nr:hypothetical protein [Enterococcus gallinarum]MDT2697970.1 hypothetical protein [Enterococcus gallinarum]